MKPAEDVPFEKKNKINLQLAFCNSNQKSN